MRSIFTSSLLAFALAAGPAAAEEKKAPSTTDEAKQVEGAVARESQKAKDAEQAQKVKDYEAGKLKVSPKTSDEAKMVGGAVAKESEKGAAPVAPPKPEKK